MNIDQILLPESLHLKIDRIAEGVFAAYSLDGSAAIGNAGIIDLGDRTLIFDTFESPIVAEELRAACHILTGKPATWVVNSHAHADHWFGNQVFPEQTIIVASKVTFDNMQEYLEEVNQEKTDPSEIIDYVQSLKDQHSNEDDPLKRKIVESSMVRFQYYLESLPSLNLRLPDQTFEGQIEFIGSQRSVTLVDVGAAHTSGDSYLSIQSENIDFLGDLGFFQEQPFMADCDPGSWLSVLHKLKNSDIDVFIPGHGPAGTKTDLELIEEYIKILTARVTEALSQGKTADWVLSQQLPEPFRTWAIGGSRLEVNVEALFEQLSNNE